ncbi:MAG TPA: insulinase family protein, partial [Saprospiraceae bacterium]|nr:insulinase family protein [Saprospiraceae bacterium]
LQTAIKIGRRLFPRRHPDFDGIFVLNTLLGGYFGSRLMMNIREKRGYTYNIYSTADAMLHDGCFYIATEVNSDKAAVTVREIMAEMRHLCERPVENEELSMVRGYLLGMLLNGLDGPVNASDLVRNLIVDELPRDAFDRLVHTVRHISATELQALARKYLQPEDYWIVTVG